MDWDGLRMLTGMDWEELGLVRADWDGLGGTGMDWDWNGLGWTGTAYWDGLG